VRLSAQTLGDFLSLEDLGNIGEFISALAVVISLIYLAVQIRQNTMQMRENTEISRLQLQENFVSGQERLTTALLASEEMYGVSDRLRVRNSQRRIESGSAFCSMVRCIDITSCIELVQSSPWNSRGLSSRSSVSQHGLRFNRGGLVND
jgi:hypothetical protein